MGEENNIRMQHMCEASEEEADIGNVVDLIDLLDDLMYAEGQIANLQERRLKVWERLKSSIDALYEQVYSQGHADGWEERDRAGRNV